MAGLFNQALFQPDTFQGQGLEQLNVFQKCLFQPDVFQTDVCDVVIPPVVIPPSGGGSFGYGNRTHTWLRHQRLIEQAIQNDDEELLEIIQIIMATEQEWAA